MDRKFRPNVFVKAFKMTNSLGYLSEDDFNLFKQKLEEKQNLYFNENINDFCFSNFREATKEIKRIAHNANLKAELIKSDYDSFKNFIKIKGSNVKEINFIISLAKVFDPKTKSTNFIITKLEAWSNFNLDNSPYRIINIDNDMLDCNNITYVYQECKPIKNILINTQFV